MSDPSGLSMLSVVTTVQRPLREIFERSFADDFPLQVMELDTAGKGGGDFRTASWYNAILAKQRAVVAKIVEHWGKTLIVSDIDIQFFRPMRPVIERLLREDLDMLFQNERLGARFINSGFIILRCNERVKAVYDAMLAEDLRKFIAADQDWLNRKIGSFPMRWDLLPHSFYAWSQSPGRPPPDIVLHHANGTPGPHGLQQKLKQLEMVRQLVEERRGNVK